MYIFLLFCFFSLIFSVCEFFKLLSNILLPTWDWFQPRNPESQVLKNNANNDEDGFYIGFNPTIFQNPLLPMGSRSSRRTTRQFHHHRSFNFRPPYRFCQPGLPKNVGLFPRRGDRPKRQDISGPQNQSENGDGNKRSDSTREGCSSEFGELP